VCLPQALGDAQRLGQGQRGLLRGRLVTAEPKPIPGFFWSRDSIRPLRQGQRRRRNFNVAVDPAAPAAGFGKAPAARNITDAKGARASIYALPKADPDVMFVGLNDRDAAWHDVYKVRISTGERTLVRKNTERISGWNFDLAGNLVLAERVADNGDTEVLRVDPAGLTKVYSCTVFESCGITRIHKDGKRAYMETNKGDTDLSRLVVFDPETGKEEVVESDPWARWTSAAVFSRPRTSWWARRTRTSARASTSATRPTRRTTSCSSRSCPAARSRWAEPPPTTSSGS
jgi:hypothetical protein